MKILLFKSHSCCSESVWPPSVEHTQKTILKNVLDFVIFEQTIPIYGSNVGHYLLLCLVIIYIYG